MDFNKKELDIIIDIFGRGIRDLYKNGEHKKINKALTLVDKILREEKN